MSWEAMGGLNAAGRRLLLLEDRENEGRVGAPGEHEEAGEVRPRRGVVKGSNTVKRIELLLLS